MNSICSELSYKNALKRASSYSNKPPLAGSEEDKNYKKLLADIAAYEELRFTIKVPKFRLNLPSMTATKNYNFTKKAR